VRLRAVHPDREIERAATKEGQVLEVIADTIGFGDERSVRKGRLMSVDKIPAPMSRSTLLVGHEEQDEVPVVPAIVHGGGGVHEGSDPPLHVARPKSVQGAAQRRGGERFGPPQGELADRFGVEVAVEEEHWARLRTA
jgi:hypothetical protein